MRNDVRLGDIFGGDHLEVHWRSSWGTAVLNTPSTYNFVGQYPPAKIPVNGAVIPTIRFAAEPFNPANPGIGTGFPSWDVSVNPPRALPDALGPLQNCTSTTPDTIIAPGRYFQKLTLNGTCAVRLTAGKYYFDELQVEPDAQIKLDHSGGAIEIYVRNKVNFKGRMTNVAGRAGAHVLGYFGTETLFIQGVHGFRGTIVAPRATIDLNSRAHAGAFYGKKVTVHQGAWVTRDLCADGL